TTVGNHCRIAYEFDLGGKRYHHDGKRCEAKLKQQIPIYYLASNPDVSMGEPPARVLGNFLVFFLVFVLMASALISTKFWQRRNRDSRMKVNR
ncbi:hypothetical protein, partial [Streptomyces javensis]|uniref:hypothetical protein n=1 Tax=Streptomyces javensis TaxID=114698 RepID=UPI001BE404FB